MPFDLDADQALDEGMCVRTATYPMGRGCADVDLVTDGRAKILCQLGPENNVLDADQGSPRSAPDRSSIVNFVNASIPSGRSVLIYINAVVSSSL